MTITIRTAGNGSNLSENSCAAVDNNKSESRNKSKTIFAGNLNMPSDTSVLVEQKRRNARKQAMKLINDAWERDNKTAESIQNMKDDKAALTDKLSELLAKQKSIDDNKKAIMEEYGVAPDSEEQKDLELLEKYQNYKNGSAFDSFSEDEIKRLKELQDIPRTEYQNKVLQQNGAAGAIGVEVNKIENQLIAMTEAIHDAGIEQLKSQDMIKAEDAADELMGAANDEAFGLLVKEGMENIDEKLEEEKEKAEEAAEKRGEREEKLQEAKEMEELVEGDIKAEKIETNVSLRKQSTGQVAEAQKNIQRILVENNLINEDLKGIEIDFNF